MQRTSKPQNCQNWRVGACSGQYGTLFHSLEWNEIRGYGTTALANALRVNQTLITLE